MKTYITFGQEHIHQVGGKIFDKDCVAVIEAIDEGEARVIAHKLFKGKFCTSYSEDTDFPSKIDLYFPRGVIPIEEEDHETIDRT